MRRRHVFIAVFVVFLAISVLLVSKIKFKYSQDHEGIFILKGQGGAWLEVSDDVFPEQTHRLLWFKLLNQMKDVSASGACVSFNKPCTNYEWNAKTGRGFIKTLYPNGNKLVINLGRFLDSDMRPVSGLFIGGGLPPDDPDFKRFDKNETGMAYYDGSRYYHIWCNVNEGVFDAESVAVYPSQWAFVSSQVLVSTPGNLSIVSRHQALINNVPVTIERFLYYQTGDTFVTLVTNFRNVGTAPTQFSYLYGDEPWIGDYGTSVGNVGWLKDRIAFTEMEVDTSRYTYAGMFDYGNPLAGETHDFYSKKANFIEWQPDNHPNTVYFGNQFGRNALNAKKTPLNSKDNRVIALQWGPDVLHPGQTFSFTIAVGMADNDPKTGFPVKPDTHMY